MPKAKNHFAKRTKRTTSWKLDVAKWVVPPLAAQIFWQIFWHYLGGRMLTILPILVVKIIFVAVTCILIFWLVWQISEKWLKDKSSSPKRRLQFRWPLLVMAIVAATSPFWVGLVIQGRQTRPYLTVDFHSSYYIPSTGDIVFHIVNNGNAIAYQYYPLMFTASANQAEKVFKASQLHSSNPIEPGPDGENSESTFNSTTPVTGIWYIYYKPIYSDSPTEGHFYTDSSHYWLYVDFDNQQIKFNDLIDPEELAKFKAAINASYPDADIK